MATPSRRTVSGAALATTFTMIIAGCAVTPPRAPSATDAQHINPAYHGRFAVRYVDQNGHDRNAYGNFDWQEQSNVVTLQLNSPFGQTLAIITSSPAQAALELPNQQPLSAENVTTLMQNALGFTLPVEGLRYWLQSQPAPDSHAQITTAPEQPTRIQEIDQDGWSIKYLEYTNALSPRVKRLNLMRTTPPLDIKLVIDP